MLPSWSWVSFVERMLRNANILENSLGIYMPDYASVYFSKATARLSVSVSGFLVNQKNFAKSWSPYLLEDMMATDYTFLEEEKVFEYFANTRHLATLSFLNTTTVSARILHCHVLGVASIIAPLLAHILY